MTKCPHCGDDMEGYGDECNWCSNCGSFTFESGLYEPAAPAYFEQRKDLLAACKALLREIQESRTARLYGPDEIENQAIAAIAKAEAKC